MARIKIIRKSGFGRRFDKGDYSYSAGTTPCDPVEYPETPEQEPETPEPIPGVIPEPEPKPEPQPEYKPDPEALAA